MNKCCEWSRCELLHKIKTYDFNLPEISLYQHMHPSDTQAMEYYQYYRQLSEQAKCEFKRCYGPLTNRDNQSDKWKYIYEPWPWEGED